MPSYVSCMPLMYLLENGCPSAWLSPNVKEVAVYRLGGLLRSIPNMTTGPKSAVDSDETVRTVCACGEIDFRFRPLRSSLPPIFGKLSPHLRLGRSLTMRVTHSSAVTGQHLCIHARKSPSILAQ